MTSLELIVTGVTSSLGASAVVALAGTDSTGTHTARTTNETRTARLIGAFPRTPDGRYLGAAPLVA